MSLAVKNDPSIEPASGPDNLRDVGIIDAKHSPHRQFRLIGKNAVDITKSAGELLELSLVHDNVKVQTLKLASAIGQIQSWCDKHASEISSAFLRYQSGRVTVFFIASGDRANLQLDDPMTDLEVELGRDTTFSYETFQIPARSLDRFVCDQHSLIWEKA